MNRFAITRAEYEAAICKEMRDAKVAPFKTIALGDWKPVENCCHVNANTWVRSTPCHSPVRGWIFYKRCLIPTENDPGHEFTAHSVVRDEKGILFDITPVPDERIRPWMRFIPHIGEEDLFWRMEKSNRCICCPPTDCHRDFEFT
jgi:hypothetical protein